MPDLPDWATGDIETIREPLTDLAELAVRLGSPQAYERGGSTLLIEDFASGLASWEVIYTGAEGFVSLSPRYANYGGMCLLLRGGATDDETEVERRFPLENIGRWGIEMGLPAHDGVNQIVITQLLGQFDGGAYAQLTIDLENMQVLIYVADVGNTVVIDNFHIDSGDNYPIVFKLIADYDDKIFTQLYFNEYRVNLRDYALPDDDTYTAGVYVLDVLVREDDTPPGLVWVDYIVITTDEPDKVVPDE